MTFSFSDDIVTPQERDTGLMNALLAAGTIRAAFVGHNHGKYDILYFFEPHFDKNFNAVSEQA